MKTSSADGAIARSTPLDRLVFSGFHRFLSTVGIALCIPFCQSCGLGGAVSPSGPAIGVICIPAGCNSGAVYDGPLSVGSADPTTLSVSVSRNRVTASTQLRYDTTRRRYVGQIVGPLSVDMWLDTSVMPSHFWLHIFGRPELLSDGDTYELSVTSAAATLLQIPRKPVSYTRTTLSDPNCGAACVHVNL